MLLWSLLVVLPAFSEASQVFGCSLPPPSTQKFNATTAEKTWYQQYQYQVPILSWIGCITYEQSPGDSDTEMYLNGNFSKLPIFPLSAKATFNGNRLDKVYKGIWYPFLSGPYNVVYTDADLFIDHYCFLGNDVVQVFTNEKNPSAEVLERMWKVVAESPEVNESKLRRVAC
ncbi:uncharacterized protein LOC126199684 [Schistocerca nitens]|uniref:uncharacterized protein LOC126199684 n=1 Tax=Schistocerca nitens TaxID=7011 RepID=UPI002117B5AF|nr:uncharacterized protein LOC126199684 [Schistocerca nitens]